MFTQTHPTLCGPTQASTATGGGGLFGKGSGKRSRAAAAAVGEAGAEDGVGQQKPEVEIVPDSWIWNLGSDGAGGSTADGDGSAEATTALKQLPMHLVSHACPGFGALGPACGDCLACHSVLSA
jgi:hypothetical protein